MARVEPISGDALGLATPKPRAVPAPATVGHRRHVALRRFSLWSVAKLALAFWASIGLFAVTMSLLTWQMLRAMGVVGNVEGFVGDLTNDTHFRFVPAQLMLTALLAASAFVLAMTTLTLVA